MRIVVTELLDEGQVLRQERRWQQAIRDFEAVVPSWVYHAERLALTMCRGWNTTAAVDGIHLFWNPEFTASLTDKQLLFLLDHEVFHVVAGHLWRGQKYFQGLTGGELSQQAGIWNQAVDYAIHQAVVPLIDSGYYSEIEFIPSGLYDVKYAGMSAESIFADLKANPPVSGEPGGPGGDGSGQQVLDVHILRGQGDAPAGAIEGSDGSWVLITDADGNPLQPAEGDPTPEPMDPRQLKRQIRREIQDAKLEKEGGSGQGSGSSEVDATTRTKQNWDILKRFLVQCARTDYSYARPNRNYLVRGMIVPGLRSEALRIKIAIDTSASINRDLLNRFGVEVEGIRDQLGDHEIELITCSQHIPKGPDGRELTQVVRTGEPINWKIKKGGGTSFIPVFNYIQNQGDSPACLIYFTDGEGSYPNYPSDYPVLWAMPAGCKVIPPFGEKITLEAGA